MTARLEHTRQTVTHHIPQHRQRKTPRASRGVFLLGTYASTTPTLLHVDLELRLQTHRITNNLTRLATLRPEHQRRPRSVQEHHPRRTIITHTLDETRELSHDRHHRLRPTIDGHRAQIRRPVTLNTDSIHNKLQGRRDNNTGPPGTVPPPYNTKTPTPSKRSGRFSPE